MNNDSIGWFTKTLSFYFLSLILGAINIGAIGSVLKILGFIPIIIWLFSTKGKLFLNPLFNSASLFLVWTAVSVIWSINMKASVTRALTQLSFILLLAAASAYDYNSDEIHLLKKSLIWSSRISVMVSLLFSASIEGRLRLYGVVTEDPNYLCMYFIFGIVHAVEGLLGENKAIKKGMYLAELFAYLYVIISTGSRGGALAAAAAFAIHFFMIQGEKQLSFTRIAGNIVFVAVSVAGLYIATNLVAESILYRFTVQSIISTGGTGRTQLWSDAWRTFRDSGIFREIFGYGTGTAKTIAANFNFSYVNVIHNIFLENLLEVGTIGVGFYLFYIYRFWNFARKADHFCFSVISGLIVMSLTVSAAAFKPYWNILVFTICVFRSEQSDEGLSVDEESACNSCQ
ncbi:MAG: O-antigen ligase family protein [Clostridia bacterium]|nr:O-antigen ligase family protein [Clostridia bacterium]